jgi:hypothetical protein
MNIITTVGASFKGGRCVITIPFNSNIVYMGIVENFFKETLITFSYVFDDMETRTEEKHFLVLHDNDQITIPATQYEKSILHNDKMYHVFYVMAGV